MDKIYVTGHRNPDTDSIVAAMAYAACQDADLRRKALAAQGAASEAASLPEGNAGAGCGCAG